MYQSIPWGDLSEFPSYHISFPENIKGEGELDWKDNLSDGDQFGNLAKYFELLNKSCEDDLETFLPNNVSIPTLRRSIRVSILPYQFFQKISKVEVI